MVRRRASISSAPSQPEVEDAPEQLSRASRNKTVSKMKELMESIIRVAYEAEPDDLRAMFDDLNQFVEKHTKPGAGNALFREGVQPKSGSFAAKKATATANHKSARTGASIKPAGNTSGGKRKADEGKDDFNYPAKKAKKAAITTTKGLQDSLLPLPAQVKLFGNSEAGRLGLLGSHANALSWMGAGGGEMGSLTRGKRAGRGGGKS